MQPFSIYGALAALLAIQVNGQTAPASNIATPTAAATSPGLENLVSYLLPSASITSLSPSQSSAILAGAQNYLQQYTQAHPLSSLEANIFIGQIGATTTPSPEQQSSLQALFNNAPSAILANPSGFVDSVSSIVSPFGFASAIYSYESGIVDGMRTVVAQQVGVTVPTSTSTSSAMAPAARATNGAMAGAVVAVAGLVGAGLL